MPQFCFIMRSVTIILIGYAYNFVYGLTSFSDGVSQVSTTQTQKNAIFHTWKQIQYRLLRSLFPREHLSSHCVVRDANEIYQILLRHVQRFGHYYALTFTFFITIVKNTGSKLIYRSLMYWHKICQMFYQLKIYYCVG